jgi:hypothetical protein
VKLPLGFKRLREEQILSMFETGLPNKTRFDLWKGNELAAGQKFVSRGSESALLFATDIPLLLFIAL